VGTALPKHGTRLTVVFLIFSREVPMHRSPCIHIIVTPTSQSNHSIIPGFEHLKIAALGPRFTGVGL
jgi:hypothetical protein